MSSRDLLAIARMNKFIHISITGGIVTAFITSKSGEEIATRMSFIRDLLTLAIRFAPNEDSEGVDFDYYQGSPEDHWYQDRGIEYASWFIDSRCAPQLAGVIRSWLANPDNTDPTVKEFLQHYAAHVDRLPEFAAFFNKGSFIVQY